MSLAATETKGTIVRADRFGDVTMVVRREQPGRTVEKFPLSGERRTNPIWGYVLAVKWAGGRESGRFRNEMDPLEGTCWNWVSEI